MRRWTFLLLFCAFTQAAVTRVEVTGRADMANQTYERVTGKVYFAVDPKLPANRIIADIGLAPKNAKGLVEFSADLYMLRPKDPARSNGTALLEISNRGGRGMVGMFDMAAANDELSGDPLLFEQGYTLVWIGWEFDIPNRAGAMKLYAPVIQGLTGVVRSQIVPERKNTTASLGDRNQIGYQVADASTATMTVRDQMNGPRTTIPRAEWRFSADGAKVEYDAGFEPGRIYEVVYQAKDPAVAGLGEAAVRDYISYLKQQGEVKRAIGFGSSQSGRFLRSFLYEGFNADERGRKVLDGLWAHVAGAGGGDFNYRFAQPSRDATPRSNLFYPVDLFPFTDEPETDAGVTDALLARARKDNVVPKVFYTDGSCEYYGRVASLIHTSLDGKRDVEPSRDTRIYYLAGAPHGANGTPSRTNTKNLTNPLDYRPIMRALLGAMNAWITDGTAPPASRIPHINKDEMTTLESLAFPKIPGVEKPVETARAWHLDYGPEFRSKRIISLEPPKVTGSFPVLVPQVNSDGNETAGIRPPDQLVPLATYTGWNQRNPAHGAPEALVSDTGSMIPFARTRAEREASGDPRPSIEERYKDQADYLRRVEVAAKATAVEGFLLDRDVTVVVSKARQRWESLMTPAAEK